LVETGEATPPRSKAKSKQVSLVVAVGFERDERRDGIDRVSN